MTQEQASTGKKRTRWRRWFRWLGTLAIIVLAGIVLGLFYLSQVGLPLFAKHLLQAELKVMGLNLEFERLRWRLEKGLVAEGVELEINRTPTQQILAADGLAIRLHGQTFLTGQPKISSVLLENGRLAIPLLPRDALESLEFNVDQLQTKLSFPSPNLWILEDFRAQCLGLQLELQGQITNAYALAGWRPPTRDPEQTPRWPKVLREVIAIRQQLQFKGSPRLSIQLNADAAHPELSTATLALTCDALQSPWGAMERFSLSVLIEEQPTDALQPFESSWSLAVGQLSHQGSVVNNLHVTANVSHDSQTGRISNATWTLNSSHSQHREIVAEALQIIGSTSVLELEQSNQPHHSELEVVVSGSQIGQSSVDRLHLSTTLEHKGLDWRTARNQWTARMENLISPWANVAEGSLSGTLFPRSHPLETSQPLGPWDIVRDFQIESRLIASQVTGDNVEAEALELELAWTAPKLTLSRLGGTLYEGQFDFSGDLNTLTRVASLGGTLDFDVHRIKHLLTPKGRRWLNQYTFEQPPEVEVQASATLPAWDDPDPNWRSEVKPTLVLDGRFKVASAAFRQVPVTGASSSLQFTNMIWNLPDLHVRRPEGDLFLAYRCDARTQDYHWKIDTLAHYPDFTPLLSDDQKKGFALLEFSQPVKTTGEIWGRWHAPELTRLKTRISTTDLAFRQVPIKSIDTKLAYVNGLLTAETIRMERQEGIVSADLASYNAHTRLVTVTNVISTADTAALAKMLGPNIERSFNSYRFQKPPQILANGIIPVDAGGPANVAFQVSGGPFAFWRFNVPQISANVDWVNQDISIRDVAAPFYDGKLSGSMDLKLQQEHGVAFSIDGIVEDSNLNHLFRDVVSPDHGSHGILSGHIVINSGITDDWNSWQGQGRVKLREGYLWNTPLFGLVSPLLNTVSPGLGNSRAESGDATFTITDSIIHTRNLIIQEPATRLLYQGDLDFEGNLDARVEAELLRDTPMVGRVVSLALWPFSKLFVYRITGDLKNPIAKPIYVLPKFLLNPIGSLRSSDN